MTRAATVIATGLIVLASARSANADPIVTILMSSLLIPLREATSTFPYASN